MTTVVTILSLLVAVILSAALARIAKAPAPLVQVILGAMIAMAAGASVELDPELFFLLFLPPLLFLDGWRIPREDLLRDRAVVLELALGLVVMTVLVLGLLIHWLLPATPIAVAFALAAVLSPTDPVAVTAIASHTPIPRRMLHILEGEALLNDASGLVCMRFAVAALITGVFSPIAAIATFLWLAIGGLAIGAGVTWGVFVLKGWTARRMGEDTGAEILISLLIPFGAYLLAEGVHASGILAAVAAGVTMGFVEQSGNALAITRVRRAAVWDTVQFAANGVIFVLLGEQMPGVIAKADEATRLAGRGGVWRLAAYVLVITAALAALRFVWVWISLRLTILRAGRRRVAPTGTSFRLVAAMSLAGVRGAVTLAGVLTFPLNLPDGAPFPGRDLAIFLSAGVILTSLITASIGLPATLQKLELPPEPSKIAEIDRARVAAAKAAVQAIEGVQRDIVGHADAALYAETTARILELYQQRIEGRLQTPEAAALRPRLERIERTLRLAGLAAERDEIYRLSRAHQLEHESARRMIREIDLLEARYRI